MYFPTDGFSSWLVKHGPWGLFILLAIGIIGLPIPDETLIVLSGVLCAKGHMNPLLTYPLVLAGAVCGITLSYFLGYFAGQNLLRRHGYWIGITETKLEKVHYWFERKGKWILVFGYFIPGVRHLTGFVVGTAYLNYSMFAFFAYLGAFLWGTLFFTMGYFFFDLWTRFNLGQFFS